MKPLAVVAFIAADVALRIAVCQAQHGDLLIYSTENNGGALTVDYDFGPKVLIFQNVCLGGLCLYSSSDPGFMSPSADLPDESLFGLAANTQVSIEIVAIAAAASVKVGDTVLRMPGESARLGTAPGLHDHPSWQVTTAAGAPPADFPVSFKLTTPRRYDASQTFTLTLTNNLAEETSTPSATPTPSPSVTPTYTQPPSATPTSTRTASPTITPTSTQSETPVPSATRTETPTEPPPPSPSDTPSPPSPSPTVARTPTPLPGDANCDTQLSAADLPSFVTAIAAASTPSPCGADIVADGLLNAEDLQALMSALFGPSQ